MRIMGFWLRTALLASLLAGGWFSAPPAPGRQVSPDNFQGASILPSVKNTRVRLVTETITFDILPEAPGGAARAARAQVSAVFTLRNLGTREEGMDVLFPLMLVNDESAEPACLPPALGPFEGLTAEVNGVTAQLAATQTVIAATQPPQTTFRLPPRGATPGISLRIPQEMVFGGTCWVRLPALFPPGKEVTVKIRYTTTGTLLKNGLYTSFLFDLTPGTRWHEAVETILVFFHPAYGDAVGGVLPCLEGLECPQTQDTFISRNDDQHNYLREDVLNPAFWETIRQAAQGANDRTAQQGAEQAAAWSGLGERLYQAVTAPDVTLTRYPHPWALYRAAVSAYQKALQASPRGVEWNEGYTELLCWNARGFNYGQDGSDLHMEMACAEQARRTLALAPESPRVLQALRQFDPTGSRVNLSGAQPDYRVLTPLPTLPPRPSTTPPPLPHQSADFSFCFCGGGLLVLVIGLIFIAKNRS